MENGKEATSEATSTFERIGAEAKDMVSQSLNVVKAGTGELYQQGQEKVGQMGRQVQGLVKSKPWTALLITLGIGIGAGFIAGCRNRKK